MPIRTAPDILLPTHPVPLIASVPDFDTSDHPTVAKLNRCVVLVKGLFRCMPKKSGTRPLVLLEELFQQDEIVVRCAGPQLGVKDLAVLQAVVAVATREVELSGRVLKYNEVDDGAPVLVRISLARLGAVMGYDSSGSGAVNTVITDALARLCSLRLSWAPPTALAIPVVPLLLDVGDRLQQTFQRGRKGAELELQLHPLLATAVRGGVKGGPSYLKLHLIEARKLCTDAARLLHHRLSHMVEGEQTEYRLATLIEYVAGEKAEGRSRDKLRHDKDKTLAALTQIKDVLKWDYQEIEKSKRDGERKFTISRPHSIQC